MEKEELKQGNVSLILEGYIDIFSSFDPRTFSEKALSVDFLEEAKRAARDMIGENTELRLLIPKEKRKINEEMKIKTRLREHFHKHFKEKEKEIKKIKFQGLGWVFLGAVFIFIASLFYKREGYLFNFLEILLTPAGWFTFWEGLGKIFIVSNEKKPDYEFYKKMSRARIIFSGY